MPNQARSGPRPCIVLTQTGPSSGAGLPSNKIHDLGLVDSIKSSAVIIDDLSLPLACDTTSDYMGFNHLAYIKGEKVAGGMMIYPPVLSPINFSPCLGLYTEAAVKILNIINESKNGLN